MTDMELGKRERQIVEAVYRLEEAAVADVLAELADPPTYSSVRAMLGLLVRKKILKQRVLATFFGGEPTDVVAALLDVSDDLSPETLNRMKQLIEAAQQEARK